MSIEELAHTADVRIRVKAPDLSELFVEAARGMMQVMYGGCEEGTITEELALEAGDHEELLHDFLSELLYLCDVRDVVFCSFLVRVENTRLSAILKGVPFDRKQHQGTEIKGVSYYGLQIVKEEESYATDILFDV
ncbi:MAG: archease [Methanomicrobiales archaeon]|nr:archease [Methanomicrobiales archaeon]